MGERKDPKQTKPNLGKIFESLLIESRNYDLYRILYETLYQEGVYSFQTDGTDFYLDAEYKEHKWHVPVTVQTSDDEAQFETDSNMRGIWMKVTIEYTGNQDLEIRAIETNYKISHT